MDEKKFEEAVQLRGRCVSYVLCVTCVANYFVCFTSFCPTVSTLLFRSLRSVPIFLMFLKEVSFALQIKKYSKNSNIAKY